NRASRSGSNADGNFRVRTGQYCTGPIPCRQTQRDRCADNCQMTDVHPGEQARLANLLKTADATADPGTSELSGFACARVATPTNWRHVKKHDRDAEIVESGSVF